MEQTATAVRTYGECPRRYLLKYERRLPPNRVPLSTFLNEQLRQSALDVLGRIYANNLRHEKTYLRNWTETLEVQMPRNLYAGGSNVSKVIQEYTGYAMNFYRMAYQTIAPHWQIKTISTKYELRFDKLYLTDEIDIVAQSGSKSDILIVDTHTSRPSEFFMRSSIWEWLKVWGYRSLFNTLESNVFLLNIKMAEVIPLPKPTDEDMRKMDKEVGAICGRLIQDHDENRWMPIYSWFCEKLCPFQDICGGMERNEPR